MLTKVREVYVPSHDGARIHVVATEKVSSKPAILTVHGWLQSHRQFDFLVLMRACTHASAP